MLFKMLLPRHTSHSILSIQDVVCSTVGIEHGRRGSQLLEAASGFLATCAIAGGGQNWPADCLQFHFAASAYLGQVVLRLMLRCDRPFLSPHDRSRAADQPRQLLETAADAIGDQIDQSVLEHQHQLAAVAAEMGRRQYARPRRR